MKAEFDLGEVAGADLASDSIEPDQLVHSHFFSVLGVVSEIVDELLESGEFSRLAVVERVAVGGAGGCFLRGRHGQVVVVGGGAVAEFSARVRAQILVIIIQSLRHHFILNS